MDNICQRLREELAWEPEVAELMADAANEIERLRDIIGGMSAAIETAGFMYRNTDSGPNLVRH